MVVMCIAQQRRRLGQDGIDRRIVRHAEGRQKFRQRPGPGPLVVGQHFDVLADTCQLLTANRDHDIDGSHHGLGQVRQIGVVRTQIERRDSA